MNRSHFLILLLLLILHLALGWVVLRIWSRVAKCWINVIFALFCRSSVLIGRRISLTTITWMIDKILVCLVISLDWLMVLSISILGEKYLSLALWSISLLLSGDTNCFELLVISVYRILVYWNRILPMR